jgi:hypothetical protein
MSALGEAFDNFELHISVAILNCFMFSLYILVWIGGKFFPLNGSNDNRKNLITAILNDLVMELSSDNFRVNAALLVFESVEGRLFERKLVMKFVSDRIRLSPEKLVWYKKGEGPPGIAWESKEPKIARRGDYAETQREWNLNDFQVMLTRRIRTAFVVPLVRPIKIMGKIINRRVVGVLAVMSYSDVEEYFQRNSIEKWMSSYQDALIKALTDLDHEVKMS